MQSPAYIISRLPSAYRAPAVHPARQTLSLPLGAFSGIASFNPLAIGASLAEYQGTHPGQPVSLTETGGPGSSSAAIEGGLSGPTGGPGQMGVANILPGTNMYVTPAGGTNRTLLIVGALAAATAVGAIAYFATRRRRR